VSLIQSEDPKEYHWGKRHTPTAWKNFYKRNQEEIDARTAEIVKRNPPIFKDGHGKRVVFQREASVVSTRSIFSFSGAPDNKDGGSCKFDSFQLQSFVVSHHAMSPASRHSSIARAFRQVIKRCQEY
jgi:hypothetical protein